MVKILRSRLLFFQSSTEIVDNVILVPISPFAGLANL